MWQASTPSARDPFYARARPWCNRGSRSIAYGRFTGILRNTFGACTSEPPGQRLSSAAEGPFRIAMRLKGTHRGHQPEGSLEPVFSFRLLLKNKGFEPSIEFSPFSVRENGTLRCLFFLTTFHSFRPLCLL